MPWGRSIRVGAWSCVSGATRPGLDVLLSSHCHLGRAADTPDRGIYAYRSRGHRRRRGNRNREGITHSCICSGGGAAAVRVAPASDNNRQQGHEGQAWYQSGPRAQFRMVRASSLESRQDKCGSGQNDSHGSPPAEFPTISRLIKGAAAGHRYYRASRRPQRGGHITCKRGRACETIQPSQLQLPAPASASLDGHLRRRKGQ
jgi:hypothetical protein